MITVNEKIVANNGVLIAGSGTSRGSNILQFGYRVPRPTARVDLNTFMSRVFIPRMLKEFDNAKYNAKEDGDAAEHDSSFLIAVRGVCYPIFPDYSWDIDVTGIYYMGSGGDLAYAGLETLGVPEVADRTPEIAEAMLRRVLAMAIKGDIYCSLPIHIATQYADGRIVKDGVLVAKARSAKPLVKKRLKT